MARRLIATVRNHEADRCAKVYRDRGSGEYLVAFFVKGQKERGEFPTRSKEAAFETAWAFAWPNAPHTGMIPDGG